MPRFLLLLLTPLLLLAGYTARASHVQGGQLTYESLGNNRYRVAFLYVRDCSGIAAETSMTLNCRVGTPTTSCNSSDGRNFTTTLVRGQMTTGAPYCASLANVNTCTSSNQYPNYETVKYTADITLPPAPEWTLSVEVSARPSIENIGGQSNMRYEATLNNQLTLANGTQQTVQNTSPQYQEQDIPHPLVCWQQRSTITFSTFDVDGDSLVYALAHPLEGCNQFSTYQPIGGTSGVILDPSTTPQNPCVIVLPNNTITYSPTFPIFSYTATGYCPVKTGTPTFDFDSRLGSFTFIPAFFYQTPVANGRNTYAVVGQVTDYRRINGRYYKMGSVRREILVNVIDCGINNVPPAPIARLVTATNATVINGDNVSVTAPVGEYTEIDLRFRDQNPGNQLTVTYTTPINPMYADLYYDLNSPTTGPLELLGNGTINPTLKMRFRPSRFFSNEVFYVPVRVADDACPARAVQNLILVIQVRPANTTTAAQAAAKKATLSAYPTPFTEQVRFTLPRPKAGAAAVLIFDQLGRLVDQLPVPAAATPETTLTWTPAATVPTGVYSARFADGTHTARLVRVAP